MKEKVYEKFRQLKAENPAPSAGQILRSFTPREMVVLVGLLFELCREAEMAGVEEMAAQPN